MSVETGFTVINAIINNPIEVLVLFGIVIFIYKFFISRESFVGEELRHFKWSLRYDLDRQLDNLVEWLERRDKAYSAWIKNHTRKQLLMYEFIILSSIFIPLLIYNSLLEENTINTIFFMVLLGEYFGVMFVAGYRYRKPRKIKEQQNNVK